MDGTAARILLCALNVLGIIKGIVRDCGRNAGSLFHPPSSRWHRSGMPRYTRRCTGAPFVHRIYRGQCFAQHCCYIILCETSSRASASNEMSFL